MSKKTQTYLQKDWFQMQNGSMAGRMTTQDLGAR